MKKCISMLIALSLLFSVVLASVQAEENQIVQDAFVFAMLDNGNLKLVEYTDKEARSIINIPSTVEGHQVERIGAYAFADCKSSNITIPSTVKMIEAFAFDNCSAIQKISIPNDVYFIDGNPFTNCQNLVNISLDPKHPTLQVTSDGALYSKRNKMLLCYPCSKEDKEFSVLPGTLVIGKGAFRECDKLESIKLPETVTEIYEEAFLGCKKLKAIKLPGSLLKIGAMAFSGCSELAGIKVPGKVSRIEKSTFFNCTALESATLPQDMTDIADMAFYGCAALPRIGLPEKLSTIGEKAFAGCSALTDAFVPISVTKIGDNAFLNCSVRLYLHLEEYTFAEIYAKIYNISYTYDTPDDFLKESPQTDSENL